MKSIVGAWWLERKKRKKFLNAFIPFHQAPCHHMTQAYEYMTCEEKIFNVNSATL